MATITKRHWKTGKGQAREAWVLAYTDKSGKRHKKQFDLQREADAERIKVEGEISTGAFREAAKRTTVEGAVEVFGAYLNGRLKENSATRMYVTNTKGQLRDHVIPNIGHVLLSELTAKDGADLVKAMKQAGTGVPTMRRVMGGLKRCIQHAKEENLIATNPIEGVRVTVGRGLEDDRVTPPTKQAFAAILKAAEESNELRAKMPDLALRIRFAARTALRASEQWALKWKHISFATRTVSVETRVDAFGQFDVTKTKSGRRKIRLAKTLSDELKQAKGDAEAGDDDFVFPNTDKGFTSHTNFAKRIWKPLLKKVEEQKGEPLGWHALRHYAISCWIEAGLEPKAVQTLAGHATYHITMSRYGHLFPSDNHADIMDMIDE